MAIEKPILFSADMVDAVLDDRKTQTRRAVKHTSIFGNPYIKEFRHAGGEWWDAILPDGGITIKCPYGKVGDELWVRENFSFPWCVNGLKPKDVQEGVDVHYWADGDVQYGDWTKPKPSIFMPRWASRIQLRITDVRVERLQDISEGDAANEGLIYSESMGGCPNFRFSHDSQNYPDAERCFKQLWVSINGAESWDENPWVWVIEFERIKP